MIPPIVIRPGKDDSPDDIVLKGVDVHLEQMDDGFWWMGCYRGDKRITFHFNSAADIKVALIEDELGAIDDSTDPPTPVKIPED